MRTWILGRYQVYARVCLIAAMFISPVMFLRATVDVFNLVKLSVLWILGIAALAFWIAWSVERGVWVPRFRIALAALAFLFVCALATVFSQNPALSLVGLYHRYGGLIPFLLYALIMFLIVAVYWERPGELREIAGAVAAGAIVMSLYVLIQAAGMDWIRWEGPGGKVPTFPVGTMGNSNFAGGYLGIAAPLTLYVALSAWRELNRILLLILFGVQLLALWFTQTRGGMIAAIAGLTTMAIVYRDRLPRWVKIGTIVAWIGGSIVAALILFHPGREDPIEPLANVRAFRTRTFTIRSYYWGTAVRIFLDNPVLGTGLETYVSNYPPYRLAADGANLGFGITDKPHNIFLEYAANTGVPGIASYLTLVGMGVWFGYRRARKASGDARFLLVGFLGCLVGYLAQGFVSIDVPPLAVMGWLALGGVAAIADPKVLRAQQLKEPDLPKATNAVRKEPNGKAQVHSRSPAGAGRVRWVVHATTAVATIALLVVGTRPLVADAVTKSGLVKSKRKASTDKVASAYETAVRLYPLEPDYRVRLGALAEAQATKTKDKERRKRLLNSALEYYGEALHIHPGNIFYILNMARVHTIWAQSLDRGRFREADEWWRLAASHDPTNWRLHTQYASMLNVWADARGGDPDLRSRAANELETVVAMRPDKVSVWIDLGKMYLVLGRGSKAADALNHALELQPENEEAKKLLTLLAKG